MQGLDNNYKKITDSRLLNAGRLLNLLELSALDAPEKAAIRDGALQLLGQAYCSLLAEVMESYQVSAGGLPESALSAQQQMRELHSPEINELAEQEKISGSVPARLLRAPATLTTNARQAVDASVIVSSAVAAGEGDELGQLLQWLRDYKAVLRERLVEW